MEKIQLSASSSPVNSRHLIVPTQYYDPETFQVNHLVSLFLSKGWYVTVIAPVPSYPSSSAFRGCSAPVLNHDRLRVCRFPTFKRNGLMFSALLNSIAFVFVATFLTVFYSLRYPNAKLFAVQYSPFTCILPAWFCGLLLDRNISLWIFDLWPQSLSTFSKNSPLTQFAYCTIDSVVSAVYSKFSNLYASSPSFLASPPLNRFHGVQLLNSWETEEVPPRFGPKTPDLSAPIRIVSIGNLGLAHDLDALGEFLLLTSSPNFSWSFVGGGSGIATLRSFCLTHQLTNVSFEGFLPKTDCLRLCSDADVSLVPFKDSAVSNTICYRFVSSLSVATPVISFGNNAVSDLISSSSCGFVFQPSAPAALTGLPNSFVFDTLLGLVESISSRARILRSDCRSSAFELYKSQYSERAAEDVLSHFFVSK